ncbi:hypothetical protein OLK001_30780 [Synechocystis sp. LKSZ1]
MRSILPLRGLALTSRLDSILDPAHPCHGSLNKRINNFKKLYDVGCRSSSSPLP